MTFRIDSHTPQPFKLTITHTIFPERTNEFAFRVELLHPAIVIISNINIPSRTHRDPTRTGELTITRAGSTKLTHKFTFTIKLLHTIMTSIHNPHITRRISSHTHRLFQLTRTRTRTTKREFERGCFSQRLRYGALSEFVIGVRCIRTLFELVAFVVFIFDQSLLRRVIGRVVLVFAATRFRKATIFIVRAFRYFRAR